MNIFVGNLSRGVTAEDLLCLFEAFGVVVSAVIIRDKYTRRPRGFAFVRMEDQTEADEAIARLNGRELKGRHLRVEKPHPRPPGRGSAYW